MWSVGKPCGAVHCSRIDTRPGGHKLGPTGQLMHQCANKVDKAKDPSAVFGYGKCPAKQQKEERKRDSKGNREERRQGGDSSRPTATALESSQASPCLADWDCLVGWLAGSLSLTPLPELQPRAASRLIPFSFSPCLPPGRREERKERGVRVNEWRKSGGGDRKETTSR